MAYGYRGPTAFELDAADGVIDGKHFGAPIVQQRAVPHYGPAPAVAANQQAAYDLDAADGVIDGKFFGAQVAVAGQGSRPMLREPVVIVPDQRTAASLDGHDGRKDGRFHGIKIAVQAGNTQPVVAVPDQYTAAQLDGQDHKRDGRYFGLPIAIMNGSAPHHPAPAPVVHRAPPPVYAAPAPAPIYVPPTPAFVDAVPGDYHPAGRVLSVEYIDHGPVDTPYDVTNYPGHLGGYSHGGYSRPTYTTYGGLGY